ncbi:hypothetical protein QQZ08_012459 [Neonectria magnoliae]|uniref:ubiquitinyl hydrolase 1 n=1 Tax=Neonectria magnoliae TaxID=2732573 RepID=A0ABR1H1P8_9HYPO
MASQHEPLLDAVFNHLVLPPKLPTEFDGDDVSLIDNLGQRLLAACGTLRKLCHFEDGRVWDTLEASMQATRALNHEFLAKNDLTWAFNRLGKEWLALHIAKQNAALLVHRDEITKTVIFEAFEVAAPITTVLEANHALTWEFPGRAAAIPLDDFRDESFIETLSEFLEQASSEAFDKFAARSSKAGKPIVETRDCPSPALISEMLMPLLEGIGNPVGVVKVRKRVRDEVVLGSSELPWKRSAYWLVLRVTVRRLLSNLFNDCGVGIDRVYFKFIMCAVLADLLKDCSGKLAGEKTLILQAKLCRRLAKLESEKLAASGSLQSVYGNFFIATTGHFKAAVGDASQRVGNSWEEYKKKTVRRIPTLPRRAPTEDLRLALPNSGPILSQLLAQKTDASRPSKNLNLSLLMEGTISQVNEMAGRYAKLVDDETEIMAQVKAVSRDPRWTCAHLSETLLKYLVTADDAFKDDAVMMSRYLLLLFELWVAMDQAATAACPLLKEYHPSFVPEALDVLCLLTMDEMIRLRLVQEYIAGRVADHSSDHGSIFDDANRKLAFPVQYISQTDEGGSILALGERIDTVSEQAKTSKTSQLATLMAEYKTLSDAIQAGVCCCTRLPDGTKNVSGCKKCWKLRCKKRLKIAVHEDFLPRNEANHGKAQRAAVVFELGAPEYLAGYRMATWKLRLLGTRSVPIATHQPPLLLEQLGHLKPFWRRGTRGSTSFTMASDKKSFQQTHFKKVKLPKTTAQVLLPFSPDFSYYDSELRIRADEVQKVPWFQHLLGSWLPRGVMDPYQDETSRREDAVFPPSSYQIAVNASDCPPEMSVHEFLAFQRAVSGRGRRWLVILVELGATNLNFSSETTMMFLNHLVLQAGPLGSDPEQNSGALRETHRWFHDQVFLVRLCEQLLSRLDTLVSNWREVFSMSIIVTLGLRIHHLCPRDCQGAVRDLLVKIREVTSGWIIYLRQEVRSTNDAEAARKAAAYAFWAALLCRQAFSVYLGAPETTGTLGYADFQQFFRASVALQENLLVNLDEFTPLLKGLLVRDLSMSYSMRALIKKWVAKSHTALEDAINETWTDSGLTGRRTYSPWTFLPPPHSWWVMSRIASTQWTASQVIHYHVLQGHLLVDGKPLGRLPLEMREDPSIRELFGRQHLLTRPSSLTGMQYQLMSQVNDHQIHVGFKDGKVVIRAIFRNSLLEHVSRNVFKSASGLDLPSGLVDDCVHWLNLSSGMLEMRRKPRIWHTKPSDWTLDVGVRYCTRRQGKPGRGPAKPGSCLVEPRSKVGRLIAAIFQDFEDVERLTIYQPMSGGFLTVEMKRLEIRFFVNAKNLLECPQLASEVNPDQDAGTLYGFTSQIVLRSVVNPDRKSIIVPIGRVFSWKPRGMHVAVRIANAGMYARFTIDTLLGRLDCAQELNLLYLKAALHALTSFPLPDRLTGRTGTEEAVHCLTSACSQPWNPLPDLSKHMLSMLKSLSPKRHYYPRGSKFCQNAEWDNDLTMTIQYEGFAPLVEGILQQSQKLEMFQVAAEAQPAVVLEDVVMGHLSLRGLIRRQIYERVRSPSDSLTLVEAAQVFPYKPRDCGAKTGDCQVYQIVNLLRHKPDEFPKLAKLAPLFENEEMIGGFQHACENINVQELLDTDIIAIWGKTVQICRNTSPSVKYDRLFLLALLALDGKPGSMKLVFWLAALAKNARLREIIPPQSSIYRQFKAFETPSKDNLLACILQDQLDYSGYLDTLRTKRTRKSARTKLDFETKQRDEAENVAQILMTRWPSTPETFHEFQDMLGESFFDCVDIKKAWRGLTLEVNRLSCNNKLSCYFKELQDTANQIPQHKIEPEHDLSQLKKMTAYATNLTAGCFQVPHLESRLALRTYRKARKNLNPDGIDPNDSAQPLASGLLRLVTSRPKELSSLSAIIDTFVSSTDVTRRQYGKDLEESFEALVQFRQRSAAPKQPPHGQDVILQIHRAKQELETHAEAIREALSQGEESREWLSAGNLWPCLSPVALLELLRNDNVRHLETGMKEALVWYGVLITRLQRLQRIHDARLCKDMRRLTEENDHRGHSNWRPFDQPEWLLLEIDNDILIRQSQVDVAKAIVSPLSSSNSVLQMNMGEGKTSCIMPMAATMLADKKQLCRLIVPRALLLQTALVIQRRIGRLVGRRVQHIPFQRRSPKEEQTLQLYQRIHQDTLDSGGIMLCLPEHILSFQLSGLQHLADNDMQTARKMIQIQQWIHDFSRDILDESDLTLSSKTQLIYPSGSPVIVDGHPHRWEVAQDLLSLVEGHCSFFESTYRGSIHIFRRHQGYPIIHFLHAQVEDVLNRLLIQDVCEGRLARLQLKNPFDSRAQEAIALIVSGTDASNATWERAALSLTDDVFGLKCLYLLRGLISERIILLCLKKRWNVQFGLHPERAPIAVPFEAKGVPSQTAEYGHPDTALVLTCLAFYQTGLSKSQISHSLQHILRTDDPNTHYEHWVHGCKNLPATLRHVSLLSADDEAQIEELWNSLRFDRHVLNYYMNNFVFPRHAKQFAVKLQTSGWDIPLFPPDSSVCTKTSSLSLTTGFSGTNDNKRLLPQTIKQDDLAGLLHTNAEVLSYLLEERNKTCYQAIDSSGQQLSERGLLELLNMEGIKVLIDAGAHVLEMENHDLAAEWLDVNHRAQGAVYFDKNGRIMVRARFQKTPMPLLVSSFADNMEQCVVYIDEAHTRGTDLKLPVHARGAVTLVMGQTKDQTVQAAMRLRQLGSTQSVAFVAPPEVYEGIIDLRSTHLKGRKSHQATSHDVVRWLLEQSCKANENIMSLHIAQGFDFCRRTNALWRFKKSPPRKHSVDELLGVIRQREDQSIEELYGSKTTAATTQQLKLDFSRLQTFNSHLRRQRLGLQHFGRQCESSALAEVEQEREVEFEVEQVREKQKRGQFLPLAFPGLDPYISRFVETGCLDPRGGYIQAFAFVGTTKIGQSFGVHETESRLFVSSEFTKTISDGSKSEQTVVRPVEWILWSAATETALIVIPEEAELLISKLLTLSETRVWLLSYAAPVTKSMQPFNTFNFFTVPSQKEWQSFPDWLSLEVGILAGRLYFDYPEYKPLFAWLGVQEKSRDVSSALIDSYQSSTVFPTARCGQTIKQPLKFLLEWLTFRRETQDITHTPMGYVWKSKIAGKAPIRLHINGHIGDNTQESDDDSEWGDPDAEMSK